MRKIDTEKIGCGRDARPAALVRQTAKWKKRLRGRRGQTMVLGAVGILVVAVMMLMTLNIGQAVYEKIRIQQVADAAAFSTATQEARLFNFLAYTNRANVSGLVAATTLHSIWSMATAVPEMLKAAKWTFGMHAGLEFAMCLTCCWPFCFGMCEHCIHGIKNIQAMLDYNDYASDWEDKIESKDGMLGFWGVVTALDVHMAYIAASQYIPTFQLWSEIKDHKVTKELIKRFAPGAQVADPSGWLGLANAGLLGITETDFIPRRRGFSDVFEMDGEKSKFTPTAMGNSHRYALPPGMIPVGDIFKSFIRSRGVLYPYVFIHPNALKEFMKERADAVDGVAWIFPHMGQARIIKGTSIDNIKKGGTDEHNQGPAGDTIASFDSGIVGSLGTVCYFSMIPMIFPYEALVASGSKEGKHTSGHAGQEHKFYCLGGLMDMLGLDGMSTITSKLPGNLSNFGSGLNCFINFNAEPDADQNWGQPVVVTAIKSDLSQVRKVVGDKGEESATEKFKGAWEIDVNTDKDGKLEFSSIMNKSVEVRMADRSGGRMGYAFSKALVYYHLPDFSNNSQGWKEHPNLMNPYWKAKLHPFKTGLGVSQAIEAEEVLLTTGLVDEYNLAFLAYMGGDVRSQLGLD